jgi:hypothetical protein
MVRRAGRCPQCGEPVSAFAAGCAICGADLEAHRRRAAARRLARPRWSPRAALATRQGANAALLGVTALLLLVAPLFGALLAAVGARDRHLHGERGARDALVGIGILGLALLFVPAVRFGLLQLLLA